MVAIGLLHCLLAPYCSYRLVESIWRSDRNRGRFALRSMFVFAEVWAGFVYVFISPRIQEVGFLWIISGELISVCVIFTSTILFFTEIDNPEVITDPALRPRARTGVIFTLLLFLSLNYISFSVWPFEISPCSSGDLRCGLLEGLLGRRNEIFLIAVFYVYFGSFLLLFAFILSYDELRFQKMSRRNNSSIKPRLDENCNN